MSRISEALEHKKAFVGFLTAGDPTLEKTEEYIVEMERAGAALIEIGIPFSDPIAEETPIQEANIRALSALGGCSTDMVFEMVERVRRKVSLPLVFFTYLNPIFAYGYEVFCERCKAVGIDGIVIPDMPYEEKKELNSIAMSYGLELITIIAPASRERIQMLAKNASGYIRLVSSEDEQSRSEEGIREYKQMAEWIREVSAIPLVAEFRKNTKEEISQYSKIVDGVMAKNAMVTMIAEKETGVGNAIYDYVRFVTDRLKK